MTSDFRQDNPAQRTERKCFECRSPKPLLCPECRGGGIVESLPGAWDTHEHCMECDGTGLLEVPDGSV